MPELFPNHIQDWLLHVQKNVLQASHIAREYSNIYKYVYNVCTFNLAPIVTYASWSGLKRCILIVSLLQVLS